MSDTDDPNQEIGEDKWDDAADKQIDNSDRQEERMSSDDPAFIRMSDGRKFQGSIADMSLGGMLFVASDLLPTFEQGEKIELTLELYGRQSTFSCQAMHQQGNRLGLQLHRV